jgi:predicted transcriptional regulator
LAEGEAVDDLPTPTPRELAILKVLWELGPSSVRAVHRRLRQDEPDLAFNTVQAMLRVMEGKRLVAHDQEGRAFIYRACFTRDQSTARFLDRVFDGAVSELVQSLLRSERIPAGELERLQALIADARRRQGR